VDWVWNGGIFHFEHSPNLTDIKYLSAEEAFERYRELPVPTTYEEFYQEELARAVEALRDWQ
jgi:hypothetical protein